MSDIKLFRLTQVQATELHGDAPDLEKPLQSLIENNLEPLFGIRFLASEYSTGKTHAGRIDTLGLDENDCPVTLEYKRSTGENVINQGYLGTRDIELAISNANDFDLAKLLIRMACGGCGNR